MSVLQTTGVPVMLNTKERTARREFVRSGMHGQTLLQQQMWHMQKQNAQIAEYVTARMVNVFIVFVGCCSFQSHSDVFHCTVQESVNVWRDFQDRPANDWTARTIATTGEYVTL